MVNNTFGNIFRVTNWGESHGKALGVVVDGCHSLLEISREDIQKELNRRRPSQSEIVTQRNEPDKVEILSGIFDGKTTGTPISMIIYNNDAQKKDYENLKNIHRDGHADMVYDKKYGIRDYFGGGRSSARITAGNVAAGAIAKKLLSLKTNIKILAYTKSIYNIHCNPDINNLRFEDIERNSVRCPNEKIALKMIELLKNIKKEKNSVGGIIECVVKNVPIGLGEPIFNKLDASLAHSMLSINASKGFELGSGFSCFNMTGIEHNNKSKNYSGGITGGISDGKDIVFRVSFKPTPNIGNNRHDPCVVPRAVPIVEAMTALVLADFYLLSLLSKV
jgi:chorismate synthase